MCRMTCIASRLLKRRKLERQSSFDRVPSDILHLMVSFFGIKELSSTQSVNKMFRQYTSNIQHPVVLGVPRDLFTTAPESALNRLLPHFCCTQWAIDVMDNRPYGDVYTVNLHTVSQVCSRGMALVCHKIIDELRRCEAMGHDIFILEELTSMLGIALTSKAVSCSQGLIQAIDLLLPVVSHASRDNIIRSAVGQAMKGGSFQCIDLINPWLQMNQLTFGPSAVSWLQLIQQGDFDVLTKTVNMMKSRVRRVVIDMGAIFAGLRRLTVPRGIKMLQSLQVPPSCVRWCSTDELHSLCRMIQV